MAELETGTVKWFSASKGYGFIARDSGGDVFVHFTGIRGERRDMLKEGQRVKFMVVKTIERTSGKGRGCFRLNRGMREKTGRNSSGLSSWEYELAA